MTRVGGGVFSSSGGEESACRVCQLAAVALLTRVTSLRTERGRALEGLMLALKLSPLQMSDTEEDLSLLAKERDSKVCVGC